MHTFVAASATNLPSSIANKAEATMQDAERTQVEVLTALSNPAMYGGETVRRIDTHASTIFLAGARAIKIKRAVTFPFLDYSTLDRRKAACEAEIAVNQPYAPEIYRGIVAITRQSDGALRIGGNGIPVEWAVDMMGCVMIPSAQRRAHSCCPQHTSSRASSKHPCASRSSNLSRAIFSYS